MSSRRRSRLTRAAGRHARRPRPLHCDTVARPERLEPRLAPAADLTVSLVDGLLRIEGTEGDDAIFVRKNEVGVTVDYASGNNLVGSLAFPTGVERLEVFAGGGQDLIVLRVKSLTESTVVDTGADADLVVSRVPVEVRNASGRDLLVPLTDRSLPEGGGSTIRRTDKPNLAHEATYVGQALAASHTWLGDGRRFEITFGSQGDTARDTFFGDQLILSEAWTLAGGYQRTVTAADGTRLRETFEKGSLRIEERERDGRSTTTVWDESGHAVRHSIDNGDLVAEEVWDGSGGHQRTWVDDAGRVIKEAFENGVPGLKTITTGRRVERGGRDAAGNRVREVLVDDVLVRLDQWDTGGGRRTTRYQSGSPVSRETFAGERRLQLEEWAAGQLVRTAWNEAGDRVVQTLVGETKVREEEIRGSGEKRLTEWAGGQTIRTLTDAAGNVSVERSAGERLLFRELRSADGRSVRTTFDATTGNVTLEERATADGRQVQRTTFSPGEVLRLSLRDGAVVQRERWREGGLRRISDDGAGTIRVERFTGSDRATLAEGTKVSDTVSTAAGDQMETVWDPDGTKRVTGSRNGIVVLEERHQGSSVTKSMYGGDGSRQDEVFEGGVRTVKQQAANGSYREQRLTSAGKLLYELIRDHLGGFQETSWSRAGAWGADEGFTRVVAARPAAPGWGSTRMRTYTDPSVETRQVWIGFGNVPDPRSDYLEQNDYRENWWGGPVGPKDVRRDMSFYHSGRLVYNERTLGDGTRQVLTNEPSWLWREVQKGTYYNLPGDNVFSLVPGGGSFNLFEVGGWLGQLGGQIAAVGQAVVGGVEAVFKPLEQAAGNAAVIFKGIGAIGHAMDVNFRTLQGDLAKIVGSIDFGKISLPTLDDLGFDDVDFGKVFDIDFTWPEVKFTNPLAAIDFSPIFEPGAWSELAQAAFKTIGGNVRDGLGWIGDRIGTASDWLAKRDPLPEIGRALGVDWGPSGERKVVLVVPGERFLEAGYTRDQAAILHDLVDRTPPGLRGRYLDEFNAFLAAEGQRVYQAHLLADGAELDPAGHARLQEQASQAAQTRLLARYGLNPDGTRIPPGFGLWSGTTTGADEDDPRFKTGAESKQWDFNPTEVLSPKPEKPKEEERKKPKREDDPTKEADRLAEERARSEQEARAKTQRIEETRRKVREQFPAALRKEAGEKLALYAKGKGKQVAAFHDSVEQTLRVGGAFAAGLGEGAVAAVEGLAKTVVAVFDADTWRGLAATVKEQGRNFMKAEDKAKFVADFGAQAYQSLEDSLVKSVDEWQQASPEGRARLLGRLAGQIATESVLTGVMTKIAGRALDATALGRKTKAAVERITGAKEFPASEKRIKDAAGPNKKDPASLLEGYRKSSGRTLAEQLRKECGMNPEHVRKLAEYARKNNLAIVVRSANPNSLQWHGKKGFFAKPGDLSLKTNPKTGLVTATRRADGTLVDAVGKAVEGRKVDAQGWIVNTEKLVNGKPMRTNYRLDSTGHIVDAKGNKFFSDYDILCVDKAPVAGTGWLGVPTGTKTTGSRAIIDEMNEAIVGSDRSRHMFKHGANRENLVKNDAGIYQVDTPEIGDTFAVIDPDGSVFVGDRLYVKRLTEGRGISTDFVVPPLPPDQSVEF